MNAKEMQIFTGGSSWFIESMCISEHLHFVPMSILMSFKGYMHNVTQGRLKILIKSFKHTKKIHQSMWICIHLCNKTSV